MGRPLGMTTVTVLDALHDGVRYGLDIAQHTGLLQGTVYASLRRLEERGMVRGEWEDADVAESERRPRRRYYALTGAGETALEEARGRLRRLVVDPATGLRPARDSEA